MKNMDPAKKDELGTLIERGDFDVMEPEFNLND
jgi:hypothetical protein